MMTTKTNNARGSRRYFDASHQQTRGQVFGFGLLMGSGIAVAMLVAALATGAAFGQWNEGMAFCLSYIIAGVAAGLLQQAWFNPDITCRLVYPVRLLGFGLTYLVVLVGCAVLGAWIPAEAPVAAWVGFTGMYLAIFAVITIAFSISFRHEGGTYDELLARYREKQAKGSEE